MTSSTESETQTRNRAIALAMDCIVCKPEYGSQIWIDGMGDVMWQPDKNLAQLVEVQDAVMRWGYVLEMGLKDELYVCDIFHEDGIRGCDGEGHVQFEEAFLNAVAQLPEVQKHIGD